MSSHHQYDRDFVFVCKVSVVVSNAVCNNVKWSKSNRQIPAQSCFQNQYCHSTSDPDKPFRAQSITLIFNCNRKAMITIPWLRCGLHLCVHILSVTRAELLINYHWCCYTFGLLLPWRLGGKVRVVVVIATLRRRSACCYLLSSWHPHIPPCRAVLTHKVCLWRDADYCFDCDSSSRFAFYASRSYTMCYFCFQSTLLVPVVSATATLRRRMKQTKVFDYLACIHIVCNGHVPLVVVRLHLSHGRYCATDISSCVANFRGG